eukprot:superscaffoldBa00000051_g875
MKFHFVKLSLFLFALSPGVSVPFPLRLLPINNTETKQQPPLSPTGLNFKHIMALTGHSEQAANAAAARHGKELITWSRITLISLQTNAEDPEGDKEQEMRGIFPTVEYVLPPDDRDTNNMIL